MSVSQSVVAEQAVWGKADSLRWFAEHRSTVDDLYPSERMFLPSILPRVRSVLDIGCAAGGFCGVMRTYNPALRYIGVDVIPGMLSTAARRFPDAVFILTDGINLPLKDRGVDLVWSTGVLHLNSRYREIVKEAWRISRQYLLCDFRVTFEPSRTGSSDVNFDGQSPAATRLPYVVLNCGELLGLLSGLTPVPASITIRGYPHAVTHMAKDVPEEVIMAFALVKHGMPSGASPAVAVEIRDVSQWK